MKEKTKEDTFIDDALKEDTVIQVYGVTWGRLVHSVKQEIRVGNEILLKEISDLRPPEKEFLSRKETANFFGVSLVTIHSWVNEGLISSYKMGNRTYFRRSDLVERLLNSKSVA